MASAPVFPLVVKDDAFEPPAAPTYYLVAADGMYLHRETPLFTATVPVDGGVPGLRPHEARLELHLPRLPTPVLERAVSFFQAVYERWQGEAILILFYAPPADGRGWRFALGAPPQLLRGRFESGRFRADLRLDYGACPRPAPEFLKLGTFHSHACVAPGHSTTDEHDELYEAGLHLTAGWVNTARPGFSAAFVVGRTRFSVRPDDILPPFRTRRRFPASWLEQVTVACDTWRGTSSARPRIEWQGNGHGAGRPPR